MSICDIYSYLTVIHCAQLGYMGLCRGMICRGMICRNVPKVWGLVRLGHVNSPFIPRQSPGIGGIGNTTNMFIKASCLAALSKSMIPHELVLPLPGFPD